MTGVAILTPDPAEIAYSDLWPKVLARLQRVLEGAGIATTPTPWTAHAEVAHGLKDYACVLRDRAAVRAGAGPQTADAGLNCPR